MTNERDLIADLTLAVIDLAGAVAQIAETMPGHTKAQVNDSLNVAVTKLEQVALAISAENSNAGGSSATAVTPALPGPDQSLQEAASAAM